MNVNQEIWIIFDQPFLAIYKAKFDVKEGLQIWTVREKKICFSILRLTPCPSLKWCECIDQMGRRQPSRRKKGCEKHGLFFVQCCFRVGGNFEIKLG